MGTPKQIDFKNTKAVFSHLGLLRLVDQAVLFYGMSKARLNKRAKKMMARSGEGIFRVSGLLKKKVFKHFCGGQTVDQSLPAVRQLAQQKIMTILDYSAEGEESEAFFEQTTVEVLKTIAASSANPGIGTAVFKVTGMATMSLLEKLSSGVTLTRDEASAHQKLKERVLAVCTAAGEKNLPILIDAEHSWIQKAIDDIAESMMQQFNTKRAIVYNTVQLYRHDRLAFLERSLEKAKTGSYKLGIKLVRGAYMEKETQRAQQLGYSSPIQPNKAATDSAFDTAMELCLERLDDCSICVGTHNENSCTKLVRLMEAGGITLSDERVMVAQLKGMSDHISTTMANLGVRTAKYVPYGPLVKVIPYLLRRIDENKSVEGEASRELKIRVSALRTRITSFF